MKRYLFVCVENSCRSQMAEAFARMQGAEAFSAGSRPSGVVHPSAIEAMEELGCDMSPHTSKSLDDLPDVEFDAVVTMGCGDACPHVPAQARFDWDIPDPKALPAGAFREVRDRIGKKVAELLGRS